MFITSTPATGASVVFDGTRSVTVKAVRLITIQGDEYRRTFTASDGNRYRVTQVMVYADGSTWTWAAQLTKASQPYKNGMGLTLGGTERMAELYGADILAVVTEAIFLGAKRDEDHATVMAEMEDDAAVVTEARTARAADVARTIASAVPQPDGRGGRWMYLPGKVGTHEPCDGCGDTDHAERACPALAKL